MKHTRKRMSPIVLLQLLTALILGTGFSASNVQAQTPGPILYEGARLIVGDGSPAVENSAFIVETGRFTKIGKKGEIQLPPGAKRVDLTGKTVVPGFIDVHGHLGPLPEDYTDKMKLLAYTGIVAVTSMGRDTWNAFPARAEAPIDGARLLPCGRGLTGEIGLAPETIAAGTKGRLPEDLRTRELHVNTESEARDHVRELATEGVDCVKIWVNDRGGLEIPMKPNVYRALIDEAHRHHLQVYCDMWDLATATDLIRAGLDAFAHPIRDHEVDSTFMDLLKDHPYVWMQTNLNSTEFLTHSGEFDWAHDPLYLDIATKSDIDRSTPEQRLAQAENFKTHEGWSRTLPAMDSARLRFGIMKHNTAALYHAGVLYGVGTDGGGPPSGFNFHVEMEILVKDVGLTNSQALTMATRDGAKALGIDHFLGTVESGKDASFVVLDANPLDDIKNTRKISSVYIRGHEIDRPAFKAYWRAKHPL